jgi:hypothetical protein
LALAVPQQQAETDEFNSDLFIGITLGVLGVAAIAVVAVLVGRRRSSQSLDQ